MAGRRLLVPICFLAICLGGVDFAPTQGQESEPETQESKPETEDAKPETEKKKSRADLFEEALLRHAETVTVTSTRVETDLMKTPLAVTVIDQETLDREGVRSIEGIAQMVPNMDIATKNGQSSPMISLRGIRSTNETELGDPSVGVHLDGIYSPRMQGILAMMFDNERVEVTRGPQGTLFGRNSTVGSINIVTAKPKLDAFDMRANVQYGNYNSPELQLMVNKPVSQTFAVRFAGRYHKGDSYIDGYWDPNQWDQRHIAGLVQDAPVIGTGDDCSDPACYANTQWNNWWADDEDSLYPEIRALVPADEDDFYMNAEEWAYRLSALWQPKYKDMSLNFSVQHYRNDSAGGIDLVNCDKLRGRPNLVPFVDEGDPKDPDDDLTYFDIDPENPVMDCNDLYPKDDTYQAVVNVPGRLYLDIKYLRSQFNWDLKDNLRFVYSAGLEDQDRESAQDMDQSLNAWDQAMYFLPGTGSESWMNEIQLQSYGNKNFNWIAGMNYFQEKTSTIGYFDNTISDKDMWIQPDRSTNAGAVFAQGTYSYNPKWHLTIGYRFSTETKEDKNGRTFNCTANKPCAPDIPRVAIDCGPDPENPENVICQNAFSRDALNALPLNYFEDPSVYADSTSNDNKDSWKHNDWRVGLDYDRNENTLLYAYLATGFKAGGIGDVVNAKEYVQNDDPFGPPWIVGSEKFIGTSFDQEEVTTLELGLKKRFPDSKLTLRGAYFFSDYENLQYAAVGTLGFTQTIGQLKGGGTGPVLTPIIAYFTENVPAARIQGIELEYDWLPWSGGRIYGYASWLDTEITEDWIVDWGYDPISYFGLNWEDVFEERDPVLQANLKGNNLAVSPPFKLHMTLDHAFYLEGMKATIVPWVTVHWEDDSYLTIWNVDKHADDMEFVIRPQDIKYTDDKREAWSMVHAGLRLHAGDWMAEIYGYNLTDEVIQWWGGAAEGVPKGSFSTPLNYGLRIGYTF